MERERRIRMKNQATALGILSHDANFARRAHASALHWQQEHNEVHTSDRSVVPHIPRMGCHLGLQCFLLLLHQSLLAQWELFLCCRLLFFLQLLGKLLELCSVRLRLSFPLLSLPSRLLSMLVEREKEETVSVHTHASPCKRPASITSLSKSFSLLAAFSTETFFAASNLAASFASSSLT